MNYVTWNNKEIFHIFDQFTILKKIYLLKSLKKNESWKLISQKFNHRTKFFIPKRDFHTIFNLLSSNKVIAPAPSTKLELIDQSVDVLRRVGRFRLTPRSQADFGIYDCIPRSSAGTTRCEINLELGDTPNPPDQCSVQLVVVSNKTYAQFSCRPGHNQGGTVSFLSVYEKTGAGGLVLSGRVNIADESMMYKEVPYITPADPDKYYEFVLYQENNYGNSTPVFLSLGEPKNEKAGFHLPAKTIYIIGAVAAVVIFVLFVCGCCCCSDLCGSSSSSKSDGGCCKFCCSNSGN